MLQHTFIVHDTVTDTHLDPGMKIGKTVFVGPMHLGDIGEHHAFTLRIDAFAGHVIQAQHNILRWHNNRLTVSGRQDIIGRHHQRTRFELRFQ